MGISLQKAIHASQVLADDIEFQIHDSTWLDGMEIGVLEGVGNNANLKGILCGATHGKAHTVHGNASLVHRKIASSHHIRRSLVLERELETALLILHLGTYRRLIHMTLHDVPVKTTVHLHGTFHIHLISHAEQAEIGAFESFAHGRHRIAPVLYAHHREANSIVSHALVDGQLIHERTLQSEMNILLVLPYGNHLCGFFYNTRKHVNDLMNLTAKVVQIRPITKK